MSIIDLTVSHLTLPDNCPDYSAVAASSPSSGLLVGQTAAAFVTSPHKETISMLVRRHDAV